MKYQITSCFLLTVLVGLFVGMAMASDGRPDAEAREGTVLRATATHLVMLARTWEVQAGMTYRYRLAPNAKVTCDGMLCNLQDLRPRQRVRVTARLVRGQLLATTV